MTGFAEIKNCSILVKGTQIEDVFYDKRFSEKKIASDTIIHDLSGKYIAPGFIDTHIHGSFGFGTEDHSEASILSMSERLVECGVSAFFPTVYTESENDMLAGIEACVSAMGKEQGAKIIGVHVEGPFISPKQRGVQLEEHIRAVDLKFMERMIQAGTNAAGENKIISMTVAPEIKKMHELALLCRAHGIRLQAGHTNAKYENMMEGMQVGILHATHFFNAMSQLHHRDPGAVGAVLIHSDLTCEIIADGYHVHPKIIELLLREKPIRNVVLVTDAVKPAGLIEGDLHANGEDVYYDEPIFRRSKDDVIAGSSLNMMRGVQNLVSYGYSREQAIQMASTNPAQVFSLSRRGAIVPAHYADLVIFDEHFNVIATLVQGKMCYSSLEA